MAHITINLPDQTIHIHAQRELVFEMVSTLGNSANGKKESRSHGSPTTPAVKIIATSGNRQLVEFHTPLKIGPLSTTWKTTEWVTPNAPSSIDFDLLPDKGPIGGGLRQLNDRFEFDAVGNCTELTYKSRFGIRWSIGGWILGKLVFGPIIRSHMVTHLTELKLTVENRAKRSRLYPQLDCSAGDE